jgi:hypothetical protein
MKNGFLKTEMTRSVARISHEILAYLIENPNAQDTPEGIAQWWLLQQDINRSTALIREALAVLVNQGLLIQHQCKDMKTHYGINREKYEEIVALLENTDGSDND